MEALCGGLQRLGLLVGWLVSMMDLASVSRCAVMHVILSLPIDDFHFAAVALHLPR